MINRLLIKFLRQLLLMVLLCFSFSISFYGKARDVKVEHGSAKCLNEPAVKQLKVVVDKILVELEKNKSKIKTERAVVYKIIDELLVPKADFNLMAKLVLTKNWNTLSTAQQEKFIKEFARLIIRTYGVAFEAYDNETVDFHCPIRNLPALSNSNFERVEVGSTIKHVSKPNNDVKFKLIYNKADSKDDNSWKVYDLVIDNVSIVDSYRQVFSDKFRKQKNVEQIIADMHDKNCEKNKDFCK